MEKSSNDEIIKIHDHFLNMMKELKVADGLTVLTLCMASIIRKVYGTDQLGMIKAAQLNDQLLNELLDIDAKGLH
ncbi:MAG: hypothetical protein L0287_34340 [Anaerolineae bacterium]|nr:hypothetical protein [Anaerolineae bacterium]